MTQKRLEQIYEMFKTHTYLTVNSFAQYALLTERQSRYWLNRYLVNRDNKYYLD